MTQYTSPTTTSEQWLAAAEPHLALGWSLVPIGDNKKPLGKWKQYQKEAASQVQVEEWSKHPRLCGWAVVTGKVSNLVILDLDNGSNFDTSTLPGTVQSKTGSGGSHYFFLYPQDAEVKNTTGLFEKTDVRGQGGYAILPPSLHPSGNRYEWVNDPNTSPIAEIPDELLKQMVSQKKSESTTYKSKDSDIFWGVSESKRNDSATKVVGKLLRQFPKSDWDAEAWPLIVAWNERNTPPLDEEELKSVYDSISERETGSSGSDESASKPNQAQKLISMIEQSPAVLFHDQFKEPCITEPDCPFVVHKVSSKYTKMLLSQLFWSEEHKPPSSEAINRAIQTLSGIAVFKGEQEVVYTRVARVDNTIYYDIGDKQHVVKIDTSGWNVETVCPVKFRHYNHQSQQVLPERSRKVSDFTQHLNVEDEHHKLLVLTYLCVAFVPDIPRAMLVLHGDQGSSKSTLLKMLRSLIDPTRIPLLPPPEHLPQLVQNAGHHYAFFLDNLSSIRVWLSDALCRLITGDGFSKRQLYTDDEDILYQYQRVAGMTGVNQVATKADLLDRSIIIPLERIPDTERQEEQVLWQEFEAQKPQLLGAIFDVVSVCLKLAPSLRLDEKPRMADYFKYCVIAAQCLGYDQEALTRAFLLNSQQQNQEAIEASPVAQTMVEFMRDKTDWSGSSTNLYEELEQIADKLKIKRGFPKAPNWLWRRIKEVRPNLMAYGITSERVTGKYENSIRIKKSASTASSTSPNQREDTPDEVGSRVSSGGIPTQNTTAEQDALFNAQDEEVIV